MHNLVGDGTLLAMRFLALLCLLLTASCSDTSALESRLTALEGASPDVNVEYLAEVSARLEGLESGFDLAGIEARLEALEDISNLDGLSERIALLESLLAGVSDAGGELAKTVDRLAKDSAVHAMALGNLETGQRKATKALSSRIDKVEKSPVTLTSRLEVLEERWAKMLDLKRGLDVPIRLGEGEEFMVLGDTWPIAVIGEAIESLNNDGTAVYGKCFTRISGGSVVSKFFTSGASAALSIDGLAFSDPGENVPVQIGLDGNDFGFIQVAGREDQRFEVLNLPSGLVSRLWNGTYGIYGVLDIDGDRPQFSLSNKTGESVVQILVDEYGMGYVGAFDREGKGKVLEPR